MGLWAVEEKSKTPTLQERESQPPARMYLGSLLGRMKYVHLIRGNVWPNLVANVCKAALDSCIRRPIDWEVRHYVQAL
jgi:hypothetical protein